MPTVPQTQTYLPAPQGNRVGVWVMRIGWFVFILGGLLSGTPGMIATGTGALLCGLSGLWWRNYWTDYLLWQNTKHHNEVEQSKVIAQIASTGWRRLHLLVITVIAAGFLVVGVAFLIAGCQLT